MTGRKAGLANVQMAMLLAQQSNRRVNDMNASAHWLKQWAAPANSDQMAELVSHHSMRGHRNSAWLVRGARQKAMKSLECCRRMMGFLVEPGGIEPPTS